MDIPKLLNPLPPPTPTPRSPGQPGSADSRGLRPLPPTPGAKFQRGVAPPWGAASTAFTGNASAGFYGTVEVDVACWNWGRMALTSCAWCLKRGSESKNREEKPVHVSQSQPRDGRKGPRAGNIVNSSKSARPPWAIGPTGDTSPQPPSTAFKASVLHFSHSFPHAGPGGRRIREGCAHFRRPQGSVGVCTCPGMRRSHGLVLGSGTGNSIPRESHVRFPKGHVEVFHMSFNSRLQIPTDIFVSI